VERLYFRIAIVTALVLVAVCECPPAARAGGIRLVSINSAGSAGNDASGNVDVGFTFGSGVTMTPDGRSIAFTSAASDLVAGMIDSNATTDVFVRDAVNETTTLISLNSAGTGSGNGTSGGAGLLSMSADGRFVAFVSDASDLVGGGIDTNNGSDVFVRDLCVSSGSPVSPCTPTTTLVSVNSAGTASGNASSGIGYWTVPLSRASGYAARRCGT
jgi:Tol biopolymer transport system component